MVVEAINLPYPTRRVLQEQHFFICTAGIPGYYACTAVLSSSTVPCTAAFMVATIRLIWVCIICGKMMMIRFDGGAYASYSQFCKAPPVRFFKDIFHKYFLKKFNFGKPEILKIILVLILNNRFNTNGNDVIK